LIFPPSSLYLIAAPTVRLQEDKAAKKEREEALDAAREEAMRATDALAKVRKLGTMMHEVMVRLQSRSEPDINATPLNDSCWRCE
jgi:hypothetical protein